MLDFGALWLQVWGLGGCVGFGEVGLGVLGFECLWFWGTGLGISAWDAGSGLQASGLRAEHPEMPAPCTARLRQLQSPHPPGHGISAQSP